VHIITSNYNTIQVALERLIILIPKSGRVQRRLVEGGHLSYLQSLLQQKELNASTKNHIESICHAMPKEVVQYYSPGYKERMDCPSNTIIRSSVFGGQIYNQWNESFHITILGNSIMCCGV